MTKSDPLTSGRRLVDMATRVQEFEYQAPPRADCKEDGFVVPIGDRAEHRPEVRMWFQGRNMVDFVILQIVTESGIDVHVARIDCCHGTVQARLRSERRCAGRGADWSSASRLCGSEMIEEHPKPFSSLGQVANCDSSSPWKAASVMTGTPYALAFPAFPLMELGSAATTTRVLRVTPPGSKPCWRAVVSHSARPRCISPVNATRSPGASAIPDLDRVTAVGVD